MAIASNNYGQRGCRIWLCWDTHFNPGASFLSCSNGTQSALAPMDGAFGSLWSSLCVCVCVCVCGEKSAHGQLARYILHSNHEECLFKWPNPRLSQRTTLGLLWTCTTLLSDLALVFFTRSSQGISPQKGAMMTIFLSKLAQNSSQDSSTTTWES